MENTHSKGRRWYRRPLRLVVSRSSDTVGPDPSQEGPRVIRPIVLASRSSARGRLLAEAGIAFEAEPADLDERVLELPLLASGSAPDTIALRLAEEKALAVARRRSDALVIGCDQTLDLEGHRFNKAESREAAADQLRALRGKTHALHSAVVIVEDGAVTWSHVSTAKLTMRPFSEDFLADYLDRVGDSVLGSVGAYQLEGFGVQLFSAIDGDFFTILGLPMLPLAERLRATGNLRA
ncbi:hypothetical protein F0357_09530 [Rhizobiales bacterium Sp-1]|uniref:Nucleoside triphosphate pyrophosphatase n=1 Tax=Segnochrobactrum spirostomi TaxID=2608987 RepID=A0A6A7Y1Q1_9HYPH|nr:hypothetical protein [Segnochrobactrum spirostomi]